MYFIETSRLHTSKILEHLLSVRSGLVTKIQMKYQVHLNIFTIGATLASSNSSEFLSLITVNINIYVLYKMGIILYKNDLQIDKTQLPLKNQEETLLTEILCKGHL